MPDVNLQDQISILIELQKLDTEIFRFEAVKRERPREIEAIEGEYESKKSALNELEARLKEKELDAKKKEGELDSKEEGIKKLQAQLYQVKTNKEYTAMQNEIESAKADKSVMEEEMINLFDELDKLKRQLEDKKKVLAGERSRADGRIGDVKKELEAAEAKLKALREERSSLAEKADKDILAKYERVLKNKDSVAMAQVINNACQGCFMNLPPQVINEVKMKRGLVTCESCARILYIPEDA